MRKSELFFSPNTPDVQRTAIHDILGAKVVNTPSQYLGLPAVIGRNKTEAFAPLNLKVKRKSVEKNERMEREALILIF